MQWIQNDDELIVQFPAQGSIGQGIWQKRPKRFGRSILMAIGTGLAIAFGPVLPGLVTPGLIGTGLIGTGTIGPSSLGLDWAAVAGLGVAQALTPEEVAAKLDHVPLFGAINGAGEPAAIQVRDRQGQAQTVVRWFLDPADATAFIERLATAEPTTKGQLRPGVLSLGAALRLLQAPPSDVTIQLIPDRREVAAAREVLDLYKLPQDQLKGIPLFLVTAGPAGDRNYVSVIRDGKAEIRFFMDREQAINAIKEFRSQEPSLADTVRLEVVDLQGFADVLAEQNDLWLDRIVVVPSLAAQAFIKAQAEQSP